jgi:hypothetical protein
MPSDARGLDRLPESSSADTSQHGVSVHPTSDPNVEGFGSSTFSFGAAADSPNGAQQRREQAPLIGASVKRAASRESALLSTEQIDSHSDAGDAMAASSVHTREDSGVRIPCPLPDGQEQDVWTVGTFFVPFLIGYMIGSLAQAVLISYLLGTR